MKILADTNILVSSLLYPNSKPAIALAHIVENYTLVLTDYNIDELHRVTRDKFPEKLLEVDVLLSKLSYELVAESQSKQKLINDPKDVPILNTAIDSGVDIIISGDKHFLQLNIEQPSIMTVAEYLDKYGFRGKC